MGDYDAFAENVLKNSTQHVDSLLNDEVDKIWEEIQKQETGPIIPAQAGGSPISIEWKTRLNLNRDQPLTKKGNKDW